MKARRIPLNKKAFTLSEAVVSTAIAVVVIAIALMAIVIGSRSWGTNRVKAELQQELRKAVEWMITDLREAGTGSIVDVPADGNSYSSITFRVANGVSGGSIVWSTDTIEFYEDTVNRRLMRRAGAATRVLANDIETIKFIRDTATPDVLDISIVTRKPTIHGISVAMAMDCSIALRN